MSNKFAYDTGRYDDDESGNEEDDDDDIVDEDDEAYESKKPRAGKNLQLYSTTQHFGALFADDADIRKIATTRNVRRYIWRKFWDRLFEEPKYCQDYINNMPPEEQILDAARLEWEQRDIKIHEPISHAPPQLRSFYGSLWERHEENKRIAEAVTEESYNAAITDADSNLPQYRAINPLITICLKQLAGVDVYWDGMVEAPPATDAHGEVWRKQKENTSKSKFGTLRCFPFPFTAIFRYDDNDEYIIFSTAPVVNGIRRVPADSLKELEKLVEENTRDDVIKVQETRQKLRSLDGQDIIVRVGIRSREIKSTFHMIQENQRDEGDLWMNVHSREISSVVPGFRFEIRTKPQSKQEQRCLAFMCGEPEAGVDPNNYKTQLNGTQQQGSDQQIDFDEYDEGPKILDPKSYGVTSDWFNPEDRGIDDLLAPELNNVEPQFLDYIKKLYQNYRVQQFESYQHKGRVLSYAFWWHIYNNDSLSKSDVEKMLKKYEIGYSPLIKDLSERGEYFSAFCDLYKRLEDFDNNLDVCCWYTFWHAVEWNNRSRERIPEEIQRRVDPAEPESVVPRPIRRADLERLLQNQGVWTPNNSGVIGDELLDKLYQKIDELQAQALLKIEKKTPRPKLNLSYSNKDLTSVPITPRRAAAAAIATNKPTTDDSSQPLLSKSQKEISKQGDAANNRDHAACGRICSGQGGCSIQ